MGARSTVVAHLEVLPAPVIVALDMVSLVEVDLFLSFMCNGSVVCVPASVLEATGASDGVRPSRWP